MQNALIRALILWVALWPPLVLAQQFPVVPDHTVVGRIGTGTGSGPAQAVPLSVLMSNAGSSRNINTVSPLTGGGNLGADLTLSLGTQSAGTILAGPATGNPAAPGFRALVGTDIPFPGASALGGVQSKTCSTSNWFNMLSTSGVLGCSQPSFSDITGIITSAQCVAATGSAIGCVKPDGTTITISAGVLTAIGGVATAVDAAGATFVTNCGATEGVLYNTASSKVGCTGQGTAGQVLMGNGTSAPAMTGGPWTLLATLTASNSATLSDTTHITSAYTDYMLVFTNILAATNGAAHEIQVHRGGSFIATGYLTSGTVSNGAVGGGSFGGLTGTVIQLSVVGTTDTTNNPSNASQGLSGTLFIVNPSVSTFHGITTDIMYLRAGQTTLAKVNAGYLDGGAGIIDGFQYFLNTGNIVSGTIKIYGRL